ETDFLVSVGIGAFDGMEQPVEFGFGDRCDALEQRAYAGGPEQERAGDDATVVAGQMNGQSFHACLTLSLSGRARGAEPVRGESSGASMLPNDSGTHFRRKCKVFPVRSLGWDGRDRAGNASDRG